MKHAHRRRPATLALRALAALALVAGTGAATTAASTIPAEAATIVRGADVSWPECPKGMGIPSRPTEGKPMPGAANRFVVLGLTNGPAFSRNPCLANQVVWAKRHHQLTAAYAVTTFPTTAQLASYGSKGPYGVRSVTARLRNVGWAQAKLAVTTMRAAALTTPIVWMDIEEYPVAPWSKNRTNNRAVLEGAMAAYRNSGLRVGFYSTRYQWNVIVGAARYGAPEWHTAGQTSMSAALRGCSARSFQGGPTIMAQWWDAVSDHDLLCPGRVPSASVTRWFTRY